MPIPPVLVLLALAGPASAAPALAHLPPRPAAHAPRPAIDAALRGELQAMAAADQATRARWIAAGVGDEAWAARTRALDRRHTTRLKAIIKRNGWPAAAHVGREGVRAAFLLVQHADHDVAFQAACLPHVEAAAARGELEKQHVALLTDRVLLAQRKPQRYGTQFMLEVDRWVPQWLADPANVEARRQAMGLPSLAEYRASFASMTPSPRPPREPALRTELQAMRTAPPDAAQADRMKVLLARHGWPSVPLVGWDGAADALALVRRLPLDEAFLAMCLKLAMTALERNEIAAGDYAALKDRLLRSQGRPQAYGTEWLEAEVPPRLYDLGDPAGVDDRRGMMGLPPLPAGAVPAPTRPTPAAAP